MIVAVGAWRGTGATTTALMLAAALAAESGVDDDGAWFVEADPAGGVLAGRMTLPPGALGGLEQLAFPPAGVSIEPGALAARVGALSMVLAPADPFRADACHRARTPWLPLFESIGAPVVVDVGRLRAGTPARPVIERADVLLVVTSPEVSSAVSTVEWVQAAGRVSSVEPALADTEIGLVFVESPVGVSFPRSTVATELGTRLMGWLPWDPSFVEQVHAGRHPGERRARRGGLASAVTALARRLLERGGGDAVSSPSTGHGGVW
ncbi:MAG: hypothetical protein ACO3C1_09615 [Ilumatobacteraceae bacterium]